MIRFSFILGLILAVMSCNNAPKTTVSLHVDGAKADVKAMIVTTDSVYVMTSDSAGSFGEVVLAENLKPGYASLRYGRTPVLMYVEPGKSFEVSLKLDGRRLVPTFMGEGAKKNDYLNAEVFHAAPDFKAEEAAFIASLEKREAKLNAYLDSMAFDNAFNQVEKKRIHALAYTPLTMYPPYHGYYTQLENFKPTDHFYEVLKAAFVEDESMIDMAEYQEFASGVINAISYKDMDEYDAMVFLKSKLNFVQSNIKSPKIQEFFVDQFLTEYVDGSGIDGLDELIAVYNQKVTSPEKKAKFDELCGKWAKIAKGQPSPSFKCLDINGKEVSLSDLAGKYVYIDVWATWCGPCRGELPHLKKLEHQFRHNNIAFVSISCDQNKEAWEKMVKDEKLEGIQLHAGENGRAFMDAYMIKGIPRFILLDREGKIIAADMTRPSSAKTAETFKALPGI